MSDPVPKAVVIDSSGFISAIQFKLDLFQELSRLGFSRRLTTTGVIHELQRLLSKPGRIRAYASLALELAKSCQLLEAPPGDDGLIQAARNHDAYIFTNDSQLRSRLRSLGLGAVCLRNFKQLEIC